MQKLNGGQQFGSMVIINDAQVIEIGRFELFEQLEVFVSVNECLLLIKSQIYYTNKTLLSTLFWHIYRLAFIFMDKVWIYKS